MVLASKVRIAHWGLKLVSDHKQLFKERMSREQQSPGLQGQIRGTSRRRQSGNSSLPGGQEKGRPSRQKGGNVPIVGKDAEVILYGLSVKGD